MNAVKNLMTVMNTLYAQMYWDHLSAAVKMDTLAMVAVVKVSQVIFGVD